MAAPIDAAMSGGNAAYTFRAGSTGIVAFTGKRIDWIGPKGSNYGKVNLTLDGGAPQNSG